MPTDHKLSDLRKAAAALLLAASTLFCGNPNAHAEAVPPQLGVVATTESLREEAKERLCSMLVSPESIAKLYQQMVCDRRLPYYAGQVTDALMRETNPADIPFWMIAELLRAETLGEIIRQERNLKNAAARKVVVAHSDGYIYRDESARKQLAEMQRSLLRLIKKLDPEYHHHFDYPFIISATGPWWRI